jgi:DNA polymerase-3 subunit beta
MKIIVSKLALEVAVKNLVRVINQKNALPILGDVLFEVNEQEKVAKLTASDSEVTMTSEVILDECEGEGRFCVNAQTLTAMLSGVTEQPVTITATLESDMQFTMTFTNGSAFCPIESADEYPMPTAGDYNETLDGMPGEWLRDAIKRSLWATEQNDLRPIMTGVNFALVDGNLDIVASNGHVLVKTQYPIKGIDTNRCGAFVMPKKVANILSNIAEDGDSIDIEWNDREAHINKEACDIYFRLIEGKYPKYNAVIPNEYAHQISCQHGALLSALKGVAPFAPDSSQLLTLTFDGERLEMRGEDIDFGEGAVKTVSIEGYEGDAMSIGVKASSIIGMLSKLSCADVQLNIIDKNRPIVIDPGEDSDDGEVITGLMMPMLIDK